MVGRIPVMDGRIPPKRKKPVSQKRVAVVLASLVGTMTISAAMLLMMEGGALGTAMPGWAINQTNVAAMVDLGAPLRSQGWNFIIIYESADMAARADSLAEGRLTGGSSPSTVRPKANFHFVIDSAQSGTMDGALETGTSWKNQELGAYAGWPDARSHPISLYTDAVGVCLAADLARQPISEAQQQTLLQLVHVLQQRNHIPPERILFQWELDEEAAATPAQQAFARQFRASL
jgi:hypothetical protein